MKNALLALLGLILIGILTYFCFQDKAGTIREDLESKANNTLIYKQLLDAKAQLVGHGYETTTVMKLTGEVPSIEAKEEATQLVGSILGVSGVDNELIVAKQNLITQPVIQDVIPPQIEEAPSPYLFDASKDKNGHLLLSGYVDNKEVHRALVKKAYEFFGEQNTTDNLKVAKGAPENWGSVIYYALTKLKEVDYGDMKLHNTNYAFNGYISSPKAEEIKLNILKAADAKMSKYSNYSGNFEISTPKQKTVKKEIKLNSSKLCQQALLELSKRQKILFEYNKADIKKSSIDAVNNVVKVLKKCKFGKTEILEIGGHTDSIGNASYNKKLSQKRADSVKNYLIKQGIDKSKLISHGYGEKAPKVSNMLKTGRAKNRRIEFTIKGIK